MSLLELPNYFEQVFHDNNEHDPQYSEYSNNDFNTFLKILHALHQALGTLYFGQWSSFWKQCNQALDPIN